MNVPYWPRIRLEPFYGALASAKDSYSGYSDGIENH